MTRGVEVQNDNGRKAAIRWRALPPPLSFGGAGFPPPVILRRGFFSSVILRSESDEESFSHAPETGEKILRCAQNDNGGTE